MVIVIYGFDVPLMDGYRDIRQTAVAHTCDVLLSAARELEALRGACVSGALGARVTRSGELPFRDLQDQSDQKLRTCVS